MLLDLPRRSPAVARLLLIGPGIAVIGLFMLIPLGLMAYVSFLDRGAYGGVVWDQHTVEAYTSFLFERNLDDSLTFNTDYLQIYLRSFLLSLSTTLIALLVGFPVALYMSLAPAKWRNLLVFLVTVPFWTNLLVRNYAWILLLRTNGLIDQWAAGLGLIGPGESVSILYTPWAITIGLTYSFMPFMVLPIYASLEKLDFRLVEAAYDLGATRLKALARVIVPLSLPGIAAGSILVFIPSLGSYVTPELLGGSKGLMIGNLIQLQFAASRNWPFGAALAFTLLAMVLIAMVLYLTRFRKLPE
ncbi:ABC transporter permease [Roseospirillum parvum]|uniref:Spermidine/putrescine transport system permease protein n=1 Tax=Roseospirillum parvum TaxID=83401 RepID=A0A1G7TN67_9PROT|nr:ABC transporter permease [Roseospirillum parvum]SDG36767.1 spermidine/putrescine transport system permease protein [Roseospirillum parvum]